MTETQIKKSALLNRLYYIELRVKSFSAMKKSDCNSADSLLRMIPESNSIYENECMKIVDELCQKSADRFTEALKKYYEIRDKTESAIASIENAEYQNILTAHYIEHKSWNKVAMENYYSLRSIKYKHLKALDAIDIDKLM